MIKHRKSNGCTVTMVIVTNTLNFHGTKFLLLLKIKIRIQIGFMGLQDNLNIIKIGFNNSFGFFGLFFFIFFTLFNTKINLNTNKTLIMRNFNNLFIIIKVLLFSLMYIFPKMNIIMVMELKLKIKLI